MLSPFACGSFSNQEEDEIEELLSPCSNSTLRRSKKSRDSKNPYANRGLDKFSALLAELEEKKQRIYTQKGSEDISFVRFVYSSSNNWKPIVVKAKDKKHNHHQINTNDNIGKDKHMTQSSKSGGKKTEEASSSAVDHHEIHQTKMEISQSPQKKSINWSLKLRNLRKPSWYLPVMVMLILLFLVMYGRSFAIVCTSIGWYLLPMIKERSSSSSSSSNSDRLKRKKDYGRRYSEKLTVKTDGSSSPNSVLSGPAEKSPVQHSHRKSW